MVIVCFFIFTALEAFLIMWFFDVEVAMAGEVAIGWSRAMEMLKGSEVEIWSENWDGNTMEPLKHPLNNDDSYNETPLKKLYGLHLYNIYMVPPPKKSLPFSWAKGVSYIHIYIYKYALLVLKKNNIIEVLQM